MDLKLVDLTVLELFNQFFKTHHATFVVVVVNPANQVSVQGDERSRTQLVPHFVRGHQISFRVVHWELSQSGMLVLKDVPSVITLNVGRISRVQRGK